MKTIEAKEKKLREQLNKIAEQKEKDMIKKHYPKFKALENTFYKYRNNYSCPKTKSDYWWMYTKVTEIKPENVYDTGGSGITSTFKGWSFQTCKDGNITVEHIKHGYVHLLGKKITEAEFNKAFTKMTKSIEQLNKSSQ